METEGQPLQTEKKWLRLLRFFIFSLFLVAVVLGIIGAMVVLLSKSNRPSVSDTKVKAPLVRQIKRDSLRKGTSVFSY